MKRIEESNKQLKENHHKLMKPSTKSKLTPRVVFIRPPKGWVALNLHDLWVYRELVYFMTWRNLKVRYKQSLLGVLWAILRPLLSMVVFSIFFGGLAKVPTDNSIPYPIFSFTALLPWDLFSKALTDASNSLVHNSHMITKVYFPRIILPLSSVLSGLVDFGIAFLVLIVMMLFYRVTPRIEALWAVPLFLLLTLITALGVGLWLSALNVLYRDINYLVPFINQLWLFITPIAYSSTLVPSKWQIVYSMNPMKAVVDGFRWALLGANAPGPNMWISVGVALVVLVSGLFYFRRMERTFADMV
jgi:lipopolysaccharide transport system permease protein